MNTSNFFGWKSTLNLDYLTKISRFRNKEKSVTLLYKCRFTTNVLLNLAQKTDNTQPLVLNIVKIKGFLD